MSLKGKVALISNATTGLGRSVARRLGLAGAQLITTGPDEQQLQNVVDEYKTAGIQVLGVALDLRNAKSRKTLFDRILSHTHLLDIVVPVPFENKVTGDIMNATNMEFDQIFNDQLTIPFQLVQNSLPFLQNSKTASVIFVASFAGYSHFADLGLYSATQTAVLGMCKATAQSLIKKRIRVNSVVTGMLTDDGSGGMWTTDDDQLRSQLASVIPIARVGKSTDVAATVEFLASPTASYIVGENCVVSGGINVRL